jgi:hypothetical protein
MSAHPGFPTVWLVVAVILGFFSPPLGAQSPRVVNGEFEFGEAGGVALEWFFTGEGIPIVSEGRQGITDVQPGQSGMVYQVIPLCSPGARYRLTCQVVEASGKPESAWLGIGLLAGSDPDQVVWSTTGGPGVLAVEKEAEGTNLTAYLAAVNVLPDGGGGEPISAWFDNVAIQVVSPGSAPPVAPEPATGDEQVVAAAAYDAGLALLKRHHVREAFDVLSVVPEELPAARPEAAMALIRMQEAKHFWHMDERLKPPAERAAFVGVPYLRAVLQHYPEQTEACALARCKIGEYYLNRQIMGLGKDQLDQCIREYPGTEGAGWAKVALINYHWWTGDVAGAHALLDEIRAAAARGEMTDLQHAWAEHHLISQEATQSGEGDRHQAYIDHVEEMWQKYKETAPEVALRCKLKKAKTMDFWKNQPYLAVREYRELLAAVPPDRTDLLVWTAGPKFNLANLLGRGGEMVDLLEARDLCHEIMEASPYVSGNIVFAASEELRPIQLAIEAGAPFFIPSPGDNNMLNYNFEHLTEEPSQPYRDWWVSRRSNWPLCDWDTSSLPEGLGGTVAAWNSVNCGEEPCVEAWLVQENITAASGEAYRASIWVAAEGWEGGSAGDAEYELKLRFVDRLREPIAEVTTGIVPAVDVAKEWQEIVLEGVTPEWTRKVEFMFHFDARDEGHHAVAVTGASFALTVPSQ